MHHLRIGVCAPNEILPVKSLQARAERICRAPLSERKSGSIADREALPHERHERDRLRVVEHRRREDALSIPTAGHRRGVQHWTATGTSTRIDRLGGHDSGA